jgi:hypothetical protein
MQNAAEMVKQKTPAVAAVGRLAGAMNIISKIRLLSGGKIEGNRGSRSPLISWRGVNGQELFSGQNAGQFTLAFMSAMERPCQGDCPVTISQMMTPKL